MTGEKTRVSCGRDFHYCPDMKGTLTEASSNGFDFVSLPIVNPRYRREFVEGKASERNEAFTRPDLLLTGQDWNSLIVGKTSSWLDVDSNNDITRKNSEKALTQELRYASHLGLPAIMVPLRGPGCINLSKHLYSQIIDGTLSHQYWIRVQMSSPATERDDIVENKPKEEKLTKENDTWEWWNQLRTICDSHKKVGLALELSADLPDPELVRRWLGEPIKCAIVPTSIFLTNRTGFPVLSKQHQLFIQKLFKLDAQVMITGSNKHKNMKIANYQQYMDYLYQNQPPPDPIERFAKGYEDYLQCPLQPLMDNLESQTYEIFEKDPVKYSEYQRAISLALKDKMTNDSNPIILMVLGAGRGPLVTAALTAAQQAGCEIQVFAVEKNPNAVVTLQHLKHEMWGDKVTVVSCDMREWSAPQKADIIVSELLDSFGDNELSPECLDGAQKFLKDDGISIPESYTSWVSPLQSPKLYNEVRQCRDKDKHAEAHFETPYVVRLHNRNELAVPQPVFTFQHPNRGMIDNSRYKKLRFEINDASCVLHGFAGYFDTVLYKDITLSIKPDTHSNGMYSWFPIFFPIKNPIYLDKGCIVEIHFWRVNSKTKVWYEWAINSPEVTSIHNPNGRSYWIGL